MLLTTLATVPQRQAASPIGTALVYLFALTAAGAAGYFLIQILRNNPHAVPKMLAKVGVSLDQPPQELADPPPPAKTKQPQIILKQDDNSEA